MGGSLAHYARVIFTAGAVMVAIFLTFALSGPIPPEGDGIRHWQPATGPRLRPGHGGASIAPPLVSVMLRAGGSTSMRDTPAISA